MAKRTFVIQDGAKKTHRIRADSVSQHNMGDGRWRLDFFEGPSLAGSLWVAAPYSLLQPHMLYDSLENSLLDPFVTDNQSGSLDFSTDALFTEGEKRPFDLQERKEVTEALQHSKKEIRTKFETTPEQQAEIDRKLDYLQRKVAELTLRR
jgi:hypothetical protein